MERYADICFADRSDFSTSHVTNLCELLWDPEKEAALLLCGYAPHGTDYERFRDLCRSLWQMPTHPAARHFARQLSVLFSADLPTDIAQCDALWKRASESLLQTPLSRADLLKRCGVTSVVLRDASFLELLPDKIEPVFGGETFDLSQSAQDWQTWRANARDVLEAFSRAGCRTVYFRLPAGLTVQKTDRFHIEQILTGKAVDANLWRNQLTRFFSDECRSRGWTFVLRSECSAGTVSDLLIPLWKEVGCPDTVWIPIDPRQVSILPVLLRAAGNASVRCGLMAEDVPTEAELRMAKEVLAARVPLDRVIPFSGGLAVNAAEERERVLFP